MWVYFIIPWNKKKSKFNTIILIFALQKKDLIKEKEIFHSSTGVYKFFFTIVCLFYFSCIKFNETKSGAAFFVFSPIFIILCVPDHWIHQACTQQVKISEGTRTISPFTYTALAPRCSLAWYLNPTIISCFSTINPLLLSSLFYLPPIFFYISASFAFHPG